MKMMRLKIGVAATAAIAGLVVAAPNAYAYGNCYHYDVGGWAQVFTQENYTGNCFEWQLGIYTQLPSYMAYQDVSLRSWGAYNGQQGDLENPTYNLNFQFTAGDDYQLLNGQIANKATVGQ